MLRYLRLYAYCVRFSLSRSFEFRLDFFFRTVMDLIYYAMNIGFFLVLYRHTSLIGGWDESQTMIFVSGYLVLDAVVMTMISNNLWLFPNYVNRGELDYYLVRPVSALFFLSFRDFAVNSFLNLLFALGILGWSIHHYPHPFGILKTAGFLVLLMIGFVIHYLIRLCFTFPIFWTHSPRGYEVTFWQMVKLSERPDRIYTGWVRTVLTTVLPFCLMASFPARAVLEGTGSGVVFQLLGVTAALAAGVAFYWKSALKAYSSASS